jgi:hypothetical protein
MVKDRSKDSNVSIYKNYAKYFNLEEEKENRQELKIRKRQKVLKGR